MSSITWSILVQSNWKECIAKDGGVFWVTYKEVGKAGDQDKIKKEGNELVAKDDKFSVEMVSQDVIKLTHLKSNSFGFFLGPSDHFNNIQSGSQVSSLDVSSGGLGVLCGRSEKLSVWDSSTGTVRRELEGHLGEVYTAKLFPSGLVVLSGGADMQLKIWSVETGDCAVTLKGHTRPITDTAIVEKGKNVISVSKDGTACLWSCGEARWVAELADIEQEVNCCSLAGQSMFHPLQVPAKDSVEQGEVDTAGKVLAMGGEGGRLAVVDVAAKKVIFSDNLKSPVNSVSITKHHLYAGCQDGQVHIFSQSGDQVSSTLLACSASPVLSVRSVCGGLCVSRQDGSVTIHHLQQSPPSRLDLTGADTEPVYQVVEDGTWLFTGCRDGVVRKYAVGSIRRVVV
eukprot:GFUD01040801.1.p1 GENE.GFUD01040801.1~~GFUD01040801.1.p1  ORF type:complete len:398 (+),score=150.67 GFUD01040801.1:77-1270(+)